jgi:uncharacterized protein YpmS
MNGLSKKGDDMNHRQQLLSIAVAALGLVAMACTCSMPKLGGVGPAPKATVPVSKEAAASMQKKIDQAASQAKSTGQFKVTVTESELTSYVDQQIKARQAQGDEIPLASPQVKLTQGQMWVYGTFLAGSSKVNGLVVVSLQVQSGRLKIQVVRVDLGPLPVPKPFIQQINEQIQALADEQSSDITLASVTIREGEMDVTGKGNP